MASEKTPRQNRVREALGRLYDQQPPYFQEYLRRYKEDPKSRVFAPLAEAYRQMGRLEDAIELCRDGLRHHPDFHGGRVALAKCLIDQKKLNEAREELDRVIEVLPENLLAQRLLGDIHLSLGSKDLCLHHYRMALLLAPSDVALAEKIRALENEARASGEIPKEQFTRISDPVIPATPTVQSLAPDMGAMDEIPKKEEEPARPDDWEISEALLVEDEPDPDPERAAQINTILGAPEKEDETEGEAFHIEHVSSIFSAQPPRQRREITTETLGDLYFAQGQFDKSLQIFERLSNQRRTPELQRKVTACRARLGVDQDSMSRARKIEALKAILQKTRQDETISEI